MAARALEAQPAGGADSVVPAIEASMASYWLALGGGARGERHQAADVTWVYTGRPVLNRVVGAAFESTVAAARVRDVVAQFAVRNAPVTWLVGPSTRPPHLERQLQVQAFEHAGSWTGMALDLTRATREGSAPPGLRLLAVADAATRSQWLQVVAAGFGLPRSAREVMAELAARPAAPGVDGALLTHFVGLQDGRPVCAATMLTTRAAPDVAGLYLIATAPTARRRGLGTAITRHLLAEARARGCRLAVLQATGEGRALYRALGFREHCEIGLYRWTPPAVLGAWRRRLRRLGRRAVRAAARIAPALLGPTVAQYRPRPGRV